MRVSPEEIEEILSFPTCTVEQAAAVLGVGRGQAYRAAKAGEIQVITIGIRMLVKTSALRQMLDHGLTEVA